MFKQFLAIFFILFLTSCSNLELKNIKCNNDSSKCPSDSICVVDKCEACPQYSEKESSKCICEFDNYIMDEETNKCIYRPLCDKDADCNKNEQCAFVLEPSNNSTYLRCVPIGSLILNDICSNTSDTCLNKLSCLPDPENHYENICTKACELKNSTNDLACTTNETCIDYNIFFQEMSKDMVGMCINNEALCQFEDTYFAETNLTCNENAGLCVRKSLDSNNGYCLADQCTPTIKTSCGISETCTFTGYIYQCKKDNLKNKYTCNDHSDCKKYFSCDKETHNCKHFCRPDNIYDYNDCGIKTCQDIKDLYPSIPETNILKEGVMGICDETTLK